MQGSVDAALTPIPRDLRSFRLAQPAILPTSRVEVTSVGVLMLAAVGLWLFVLPLELLRFLAV